jgi:hypothetical protein
VAKRAQPTFVVALRAASGRDGIRSLRAVLKFAGRYAGMRALTVREEPDCTPPTPPAEGASNLAATTEPEPEEFLMVEKHEVFTKKYWSAPDLKKPIVVEIEAVNVEVLKARDGTTSQKPVVYFRTTKQALAVNATNFDLIAGITGESDTDQWPGHKIELYAATTQMGGQTVPCVRVRRPKAQQTPARVPAPSAADEESENPAPF